MMHSTVEQTTTQIAAATAYIKGLLPQGQEVQVCIVCGSGLGGLADTLENTTTIKYSDIPHFATSTGKYSIYPYSFETYRANIPYF
ncbi:hypothetical protein DSO57_1023358 [Entomophthora muscae]|uniref:Uncharacterized protein n=1 Tax=Entomophthora muscae TaxID=34485 RepID=A0ACC2S4Q5_9FUNG|nr:hypothetical protein DSO57_1023358 [Entomophthora muscae]